MKTLILALLSAAVATGTIAPANGGSSYTGSCREPSNAGCSVTINSTGATLLVAYWGGNGSTPPTENKGNGAATCATVQSNNSFGQLCYWLNPTTVGASHTFTINTGIVYQGLVVAAFTSTNPISFSSYVHNEAGTGSSPANVDAISAGSVTPATGNVVVSLVYMEEGTSALGITDSTFTYTVTSSIQASSDFVGLGLAYTVATSGTATNPSWHWTSTAGNGSRAVTANALFTESAPPGPPVPSDYAYCQVVRTQAAMVSGSSDLINFPLLVRTTDVNLRIPSKGGLVNNASGYDIGFAPDCSFTGSMLSWDLQYNPTSGKISAHVSRPTLSQTADDTVGMYYGGSMSSFQGGSPWNTGFKGVWHFSDGFSLSVADATGNQATTNHGATATLSNLEGGASFAPSGGTYKWVDVGSITLGSTATYEAWAKFNGQGAGGTSYNQYNRIIESDFGSAYYLGSDSNINPTMIDFGINGTLMQSAAGVLDGSWHHYAGTYDGTNGRLYRDGVLIAGPTAATAPSTASKLTYIGRNPVTSSDPTNWNGLIDEVRISNVARSQDWIVTEIRNQQNNKYQDFGPLVLPTTSSLTASATAAAGYSPNSIRLTWTTSAAANTRAYCGTASGGPYHFYTGVSDVIKRSDAFYGVTAHAISVPVPTTNTSSTAYYCVGVSYDASGNAVITPEVHAGTLAALTTNPITLAAVSSSPIYYNCQAAGTLGCPNNGRGRDGDTFYCTWASDGYKYCVANDGSMKWNGSSFAITPAQSLGAFRMDTFLGPETMMGNQSGPNSTGDSGSANKPPNYTADGQRPFGDSIVSVDGAIYYRNTRAGVPPFGPLIIFKTTDFFAHTIGPQSNTGPSATGGVFNTARSCGSLGSIVGCWDYPNDITGSSTPDLFGVLWFNTPWFAKFGRDWGGASDVYIDSTWHHNSGTDSNVYYINECGQSNCGGYGIGKVDRHNIQITDDQYLYVTYQGDGASNDGYYPWAWQPIDGFSGKAFGPDSVAIGIRPKLIWLPEPFNRWVMASQSYSLGSDSDSPGSLILSDLGQYPWATANLRTIASMSRDTVNAADSNYDQLYPGFAELQMDTYTNLGNGCAQVVMSGTGSWHGPNASRSDNATNDRYSPTYWWLTLCTGTKPSPQYIGPGRNQYPPSGLDLLYTFEEPSFSGSWTNQAGITKWNSTVVQHTATNHGLLLGLPQNTNADFSSPWGDIFTTAYTASLTDFTVIASFRHDSNIAAGANEVILDKSTVQVKRSSTTANACLVKVGTITSSPFTCAMDGSWFTIIVTVSGTTVTVYGSGNIGSSLPLTPLTTFTATGYTSTGSTALVVGNAIGGGTTANFRGEIGEIGFYTRSLSAPELITLAAANRARFAALMPPVTIP